MSRRYTAAVPIIVGCSQFMHQFDGSVIATALPSMAASLHDDPLRLNLAISSYLLALAVFVPISGWMADRYGAKRVFMAAIAIFTLSSVLCGLSHSLAALVMARIAQGLGGAMMTPVGRVIVVKSAPRSELVKAMNLITIPGVLAPILGPSIGGFIVSYFSWPWIFFINAPIGLAGLLLVHAYIPEVGDDGPATPFDFFGFLLAGGALACMVFGFESMGRGFLPTSVVVLLLGAGLLCGLAYVWRSRRVENPLIDLDLLKVRTFAVSMTGGGLFYLGTSAVVFLLAMLFQVGFGFSAFGAGLTTLGIAAGSLTSRFAFQPALKLVGFRRLLLINAFVTGGYLTACGLFRLSTPFALIIAVLFAGGLSRSMQYSATQALLYAELPRSKMSRATSFSAMMQQFFQSLGVGVTALAVHLSLVAHGRAAPAPDDLQYGFWTIGVASLLSALFFARLPRDAGAEIGGAERAA